MRTSPLRATVLTVLALAGLPASLHAATPPPPDPRTLPLPPYETLDANGDGIVTLPEIVVHAPHLAKRIRHCDTNGDQKLTREEYGHCAAAGGHPEPVPAHP